MHGILKGRWIVKKICTVISVAVFLLSGFPAYAQSAKEAVRALKKLEAHVETGTTLKDYSQMLGDAKFEVNLFLESKQSSIKPQLTSLIKQILDEYEDGKFIFKEKMSGPYRYLDYIPDFHTDKQTKVKENQLYINMLSKYPEANKPEKDGGIIGCDKSDIGKDKPIYGRVIDLDKLLPFILNKASKDLKEVTKLMVSD